MNIENEVIENRGRIKMNEFTLKALINLLSREGVVTKDEVKEELDNLLRSDENS